VNNPGRCLTRGNAQLFNTQTNHEINGSNKTNEPHNGGNLEIKLYFDAQTFQHVRTDYEQEFMAPSVSRPEDAAKQRGFRLKLTEEFSHFRPEHNLTLPHTYKIQLTFDTDNNPLLQDWVVTLNQFLIGKTLDPKQFDLTAQ
jgi:hypothetical protein